MDVVFLKADKPISKRYELNDQRELVKHSSPNVYNVTSIPVSCPTLLDFAKAVHKHAPLGHCLLKGTLMRPLECESRAGSTDRDALTDWICLDLDGVTGYETLDDFLKDIGCSEVEYVVQWSSSMGMPDSPGLRCHIFMRLERPMHPLILKHWLMHLNLTTPKLAAQLQLTKTGNSLRWPLDITTCQNDKLLYIATPSFGKGVDDPFADRARVQHFSRRFNLLRITGTIPNKEQLNELIDVQLNEIRVKNGMSKRRKTKYKYSNDTEYIVGPDSAVITGIKSERGFTYFNLNGGDSWGYFHPDDDPTFIRNFKGEPAYRTEDLLPEYWNKIKVTNAEPAASGKTYIAFRDFRTSSYYNGIYDAATDRLERFAMAKSETQLRHFMQQHNVVLGDYVPDWDLVWEPKNPLIVDLDNQRLNTYQPSELLAPKAKLPKPALGPTISRIISHVLGDDPDTVEHFMNWLAVIVQDQTMTGTAWILQGRQGTGKGVLFHRILTPIFGAVNVVAKRMEEIESEFTGYIENKFIVFVDEMEKHQGFMQSKVDAKLRSLIAEPMLSIRKMHQLPYMTENYSNMIFSSNKPAPVEVPPDDRRFNVGLYQAAPLVVTTHELDVLIPQELPAFVAYLKTYKADRAKSRKPIVNSAKQTLISVNRTAIDTVADALLCGDLAFFWDHLPSSKNSAMDNFTALRLMTFKQLMIDLVTNLDPVLTRDEIFVLFDWCIGNISSSPNKFVATLKHHRIHMTQVWKNNRNVRGLRVTWNPDPEWLEATRLEIQNKAI